MEALWRAGGRGLEEQPPTPRGGGGKSLSEGGGGNSGEWSATLPPRPHRGLALTAGGDRGAEPEEEGGEFPGNWFTICLTKEEVAAATSESEDEEEGDEAGVERGSCREERLCCLGRVGGGWLGE